MNGAIRIGDWLLTPASHRLTRGDTTHVLRAKLVQILVCLAEEPGRVMDRDELLECIWPGTIVTDDSLTRGISDLRKLLEDSAEAPRYIETIRKGGYRLIAPVSVVQPEHQPRPASSRSRPLRPVAAAAGLLAAGGIFLWSDRSDESTAAFVATVEPRPFTTFVGRETDPAVSPDGSRVAFAWGGVHDENYDIYVKELDGDGLVRLTEAPAGDVHPAWSPDGRRVAFLRADEGGSGVFVVPAAGGPTERLVETSAWIQGLDWSPDASRLVFAEREGDTGALRIRQLFLDGRRCTSLSSPPPQACDHSPVFSPEGTTIAFVRSARTVERDSVHLVDADGNERHAFDMGGLPIKGLEWVADERHLILAAEFEGSSRLFRMSVADGSLAELSVREEQVTYPSFSNDGRTLIYEDARPRQRLHEVSLSRDEHAPRVEPILATTQSDRESHTSPDGTRLAFVSDRSGTFELWVADADGERPQRVTNTGPDVVGRPRWSPDGQRIAYLRTSRGDASVWVTSVDGDAESIVAFEADMVLSGWTRDGEALYVSTDLGGSWETLRIDLDDARLTRVAVDGALVAQESPDGRWLFFSKALQRGIWRQPLAGGDPELVLASYDPVFGAQWSVNEAGLYFTEWRDFRTRVCFFDLATREVAPLFDAGWIHSLDCSDGRFVITTTNHGGSDLNVVKNFALLSD